MTASVDPAPRADRARFVNVFPPTWIDPLLRRLAADAPPAVVLLAGPSHIGRRELLDTVVARAADAGRSARVARLDLSGFEPDRGQLGAFVNLHARARLPDDEARQAFMGSMQAPLGPVEGTVCAAALLAVMVERPEVLDDTSWRGTPPIPLAGKERRDEDAFTALLDHLVARGPLVLHVPDEAQLPDTFRRRLLAIARTRPGLVVVLGCAADVDVAAAAPGSDVLRIDLAPLDPGTLASVLAARFAAGRVDPSFAAAFHASTGGWPMAARERLEQLLEASVLTLGDEGLSAARDLASAPEATAVLESDPLQPVRDLLAELPGPRAAMLQEYLTLAALLGDHVPSDLLIEFMKLTVQQRDELVDAIDDGLVDDGSLGLFVDHEYGHPALPGLSVYGFARPTLARAILEEIPADERRRRSTELLDHLQLKLPVMSRGTASLYLSLAGHTDDAARARPFRQAIAWWSGREDAAALTDVLVDALSTGHTDGDALWNLLTNRMLPWPAWRRLALLDAFARAPGGVPEARAGDEPFVRANLLLEQGDVRGAKAAAENAWRLRTEISGESSEEAVSALSLLGVVQRELGELEPALQSLSTVLERAADLWGPNHPQTATAHHNVASVLRMLGRTDEARSHLDSCLAIDHAETTTPPGPRMAMTLHDLAVVQAQQGERDDALQTIEQAAILTRDLHGANSQRMAVVESTYSRILSGAGKKAEALEHARAVLNIQAAHVGPHHPQVAVTLATVSQLQLETQDAAGAEQSIRQALAIHERHFGPDHASVLGNQSALGWILRQQGKIKEAETLLRSVVTRIESTRGGNHPDVSTALNNLAGILEAKGDLDGARDALRRALGIVEVALGPRHQRVAMALSNLAHVLKRQGHDKEARTRLERALSIATSTEGGGGQFADMLRKSLESLPA